LEVTVDTSTVRESTPEVSAREVRLHACLKGVVYVGHLVERDGEEVEVYEFLPCHRCGRVAADVSISDPTKRNA
jgi:hypothetical protein